MTTKEKALMLYATSKWSMAEIGEHLNCSASSVHRWVHSEGLAVHAAPDMPHHETTKILASVLFELDIPISEIKDILNVPRSTLYMWRNQ